MLLRDNACEGLLVYKFYVLWIFGTRELKTGKTIEMFPCFKNMPNFPHASCRHRTTTWKQTALRGSVVLAQSSSLNGLKPPSLSPQPQHPKIMFLTPSSGTSLDLTPVSYKKGGSEVIKWGQRTSRLNRSASLLDTQPGFLSGKLGWLFGATSGSVAFCKTRQTLNKTEGNTNWNMIQTNVALTWKLQSWVTAWWGFASNYKAFPKQHLSGSHMHVWKCSSRDSWPKTFPVWKTQTLVSLSSLVQDFWESFYKS